MIHMPLEPFMPPKLPPHVHPVKSKGKLYYYLQIGRGTKSAGPRIPLAFYPLIFVNLPSINSARGRTHVMPTISSR